MDILLFAILTFFFARGCWKGFLSMLFSLVGIFFVVIVSWKLTYVFSPQMQNFFGNSVFEFTKNLIDGTIPGTFSSYSEFQNAISLSGTFSIFAVFLARLLENITFEGSLTAGQILAPTLTRILIFMVTFLIIFVFFEIILKFLRFFLNKIIKKCGLTIGNRILGGILGLLKGFVFFGIIFGALSLVSNIFLNADLAEFVQGGAVSNFLYENLFPSFIKYLY